jgi:class 3 adenylate cyclase
MGIFVGNSKRTDAAKCCLKMNYAFKEIIRPTVEAKRPALKAGGYTLEHCAGVDVGEVLIVRAGVRGSSDLISIGAAPNIAAVLSDIRNPPYRSYITEAVYDQLHRDSKYADGKDMWQPRSYTIKDKTITIYRSSFWWRIG